MRVSIVSAAAAVAFVLAPAAAGYTPAWSQDFSITNPAEPPNAGRRDLLKQLQAWWDVHAFYPRSAANRGEDGTVTVHLVVKPDGNIAMADLVDSSGSRAIDTAGTAVFRSGFVRPFPAGAPGAELDVALHYVLRHGHDPLAGAAYTPAPPKNPFTITNDPSKSLILQTMLQRTCTGTVVKEGIRNHPMYGVSFWAQAIFFRKPDATPWVKFYEGGYPILAPVTEVGKSVKWTGREEHMKYGTSKFTQYTLWPDGENNLVGYIDVFNTYHDPDTEDGINHGGTADFTCANDVVPAITWSALSVTPGQSPQDDRP